MKDKMKVLKTYRDSVKETAFYLPNWGAVYWGGGFLTRGSSMYVLALSDLLLPRVKNPPPQLDR